MFGRKKSKKDKETEKSDKGKTDKEIKKSSKEAKLSKEAKVSKDKKAKKDNPLSKEAKFNDRAGVGATHNGYRWVQHTDGQVKQPSGVKYTEPQQSYRHQPLGNRPSAGREAKYSAQNLNLVKPAALDKKSHGILSKKTGKVDSDHLGLKNKSPGNKNDKSSNQVTFMGPDNKVHQSVVNVSRDTIPRNSSANGAMNPSVAFPKSLFSVAKHTLPQQLESEQVKHMNIAQGENTRHVTSIKVNTKTQIQIDDPSPPSQKHHVQGEYSESALTGYSSESSTRSGDPTETARAYAGRDKDGHLARQEDKKCNCGASKQDPTSIEAVGRSEGQTRPQKLQGGTRNSQGILDKPQGSSNGNAKVLAEVNIPVGFVNAHTTSTGVQHDICDKENIGYSVGRKVQAQKGYSEEDEIKYAELLFHNRGQRKSNGTVNVSRQNSQNSSDFTENKPKGILKPARKKVEFNNDVDVNVFSTLSRHESLESLHDPRFGTGRSQQAGRMMVGSMRGRFTHPPQLDDTDLYTLRKRRCIPKQWAGNNINNMAAWMDHQRALAVSRERLAYEAWHGSVRTKPMVRTVRQRPADWRAYPEWMW